MAFKRGDRVVAVEADYGVGTVIVDGGPALGVQTYRVLWPYGELALFVREDSLRLAPEEDLDDWHSALRLVSPPPGG